MDDCPAYPPGPCNTLPPQPTTTLAVVPTTTLPSGDLGATGAGVDVIVRIALALVILGGLIVVAVHRRRGGA